MYIILFIHFNMSNHQLLLIIILLRDCLVYFLLLFFFYNNKIYLQIPLYFLLNKINYLNKMNSIFIFRRDLRIYDNVSLNECINNSNKILFIFILNK